MSAMRHGKRAYRGCPLGGLDGLLRQPEGQTLDRKSRGWWIGERSTPRERPAVDGIGHVDSANIRTWPNTTIQMKADLSMHPSPTGYGFIRPLPCRLAEWNRNAPLAMDDAPNPTWSTTPR